jgi:tetratricopeptide (TPR) repeat protein
LLQRQEEALASYDRAIALRPDYTEALNNRGLTLTALNRVAEAEASHARALAVSPDFIDAPTNPAADRRDRESFEEALAGYDEPLESDAG